MPQHHHALRAGLVALALSAACAPPANANDVNGERGVSVYDQYPDCMERGEMKPGARETCVLQGRAVRQRAAPAERADSGAPSSTGGGSPASDSPATPAPGGSGSAPGSAARGASPSSGASAPGGAASMGKR